ncbi:unnamed protein product [Brassica oleracea]
MKDIKNLSRKEHVKAYKLLSLLSFFHQKQEKLSLLFIMAKKICV